MASPTTDIAVGAKLSAMVGPMVASEMQAEGWYRDPYGAHEARRHGKRFLRVRLPEQSAHRLTELMSAYRSPLVAPGGRISSSRARSSALRATSAAATFSSR